MESAWQHAGKASFDSATKALLREQLGASYGSISFADLAEARDDKDVAVINGLAKVQAVK